MLLNKIYLYIIKGILPADGIIVGLEDTIWKYEKSVTFVTF